MKLMVDAANPRGADRAVREHPEISIVAYYTDGRYAWPQSEIDKWRNSGRRVIGISSAGTNTGEVLDCEPGNPDATSAVGWIINRRRVGVDPTVYTAEWAPGYRVADVLAACKAAGIAPPHLWVAPVMSGVIPTYAVACQFGYISVSPAGSDDYDLSNTIDTWPEGVDMSFHGAPDFDDLANQMFGVGGTPNPSLAYFSGVREKLDNIYLIVSGLKIETDDIDVVAHAIATKVNAMAAATGQDPVALSKTLIAEVGKKLIAP